MLQQQWAGPLPPPQVLKGYDEVQPGLANRIVEMAEANQKHRHGLEAIVIPASARAEARGQWFGFILALVILAIAAFFIANGLSVVGLSLIVADMVALVGLFVYVHKAKEREIARKRGE